jgi:glycosyltransferase involved in cell wall biosynthesis
MATILHLITGLDSAGAERMLVRLAARLDRHRHQSVVVSMTGPGRLGPQLAAAGTTLLSLDMPRGLPDPRGLVRLVHILRRVQPDIVQTWLYHADLLGLVGCRVARASCRLFWNIRCTDMAGSVGLRRLLAWSSRLPEIVVVNSLAGLRFHEAVGYRPRRWAYIPNGCDTAEFRFDVEGRRSLRSEWGITDQSVAIGLPARYHPMKDHENFLAAAALLAEQRPEVVFILAGSGTDCTNEQLAEAVARRGLVGRVRLLGDRSDMARVYSALDITTLSSAYGEGSPNVLVEAMACGRPCIATDCGDAAQLLGPPGLIVPRRDPAALAAAWDRLVAIGPAGRDALGREARRRAVERYDLAAIAARYDALYSA